MQLIAADDTGFKTGTGQRSRSNPRKVPMTRRIIHLAAAALLAAAIASPAAALTPVFPEYGGVDGSRMKDDGADAAPAKPAKPKKDRKPDRPARADIITGAGPGAGPGRDVKPPRTKPAGLLVPAIQKPRG